jgi:MFS family permease
LFLIASGTTALWLITLQLAFHLADNGLSSPAFAGLALGAPCLTGIGSGFVYPTIRDRLSLSAIAALAFAFMGVGYGLIAFATSVPGLFAGLLLAGVGFGLNQPNCAAWLLHVTSSDARGQASANLTMATCVGQLVSPIIYDPLVSAVGSRGAFGIVGLSCLGIATLTYFPAKAGLLSDS